MTVGTRFLSLIFVLVTLIEGLLVGPSIASEDKLCSANREFTVSFAQDHMANNRRDQKQCGKGRADLLGDLCSDDFQA